MGCRGSNPGRPCARKTPSLLCYRSGPSREYAFHARLTGDPSRTEVIGSTNLLTLLEDATFADFFNTFLSLPVFGQTPFYNVELSQWSLWPEIPPTLTTTYKGLFTWLEKYRLPFFCETDLCFQYILCQEFISFIKSPEGASMMKWKKADQWLIEKCIGSVRGLWRFFSYLKGSAGEELWDFWILAEKILSVDERDLGARDHHLSLLLVLKATHLQEGSRVATLCNMNIKSLLNLSIWHPSPSTTRREILSHMQKVALFKLQSYWLPSFYTHAKVMLARDGQCQGLMQEYDTRACSICCQHAGKAPQDASIEPSRYSQKQYSSQEMKRKMWQMIHRDSWSLEMISDAHRTSLSPWHLYPLKEEAGREEEKESLPAVPSARTAPGKRKSAGNQDHDPLLAGKAAGKQEREESKPPFRMEGLFEKNFHLRLRTLTPIINQTSHLTARRLGQCGFSLGCTHWALCADAYAGGPLRAYLKKRGLAAEIKLLDLWQDLRHFLSVLTQNRSTGKGVFPHLLGNQICELYLSPQTRPPLPLKARTVQGLREMLPSGDVSPWVPRAQEEICKMLSRWYAEFLKEEDFWFLHFTTQTGPEFPGPAQGEPLSRERNILLHKRFQEALELARGLADMEPMDAPQWGKVATESLAQSGSLQVELAAPVFLEDTEKMSFEELSSKYPKKAIEKISDDFKIYSEKVPAVGKR
ncbi:regulator of G-protein signaling protein-like [Sorex araneus]|uniref:regulator of G-protein signaling protein-like n=1 Tax=Sorex araneus TaxID=42254 RepID=UPI0024335E31|nr:regulator of G-protein signaling protein-like [Sorex araneus]